ncbi:TPA: Ail/Lom family outer membrane beta-barrel protein [Escherichia coli]|nr:Ail/Lom family outer membrane beta-barrel protein [Escherichia coli]
MGKGSSKGHTPREAKDNLKSTQLLSVIDAISEGPVEGPVDGLKSVLLNSTPVLDSDTRWHEDSVRNRWFSVMAGPSVRVNEWFSAYAMAGVAYSRVSTFSGDYLRVTDNKGKTHDVLTGSDDGRHSNTSLAWGAGVQFNPTESVAIDIAYEGSGSGDWRTDGFIVGVGYKF